MIKTPSPETFEIFGRIFFLANRLEFLGDNELKKDGLTTKQWQLIAVTGKYFSYAPSVTEVSEILSTTHQNVKQIALKLQEKGFISIEKDEKDTRVLRLKLTEKNRSYWASKNAEDTKFISSLFEEMSDQEIKELHHLIKKLEDNIEKKYKIAKSALK